MMIIFFSRNPKSALVTMLKKYFLEKLIIGKIGAFVEVGTASTSGQSRQLWSSPTAPTGGSGSYWMANWRLCTPPGVLKVVRIRQVTFLLFATNI